MTLVNLDKTPFPWFGGKSQAAPVVWSLLGDVAHYVEPFFGGGAVLLNRPHTANRPYYSETLNDLDGFVVNFWRSVQWYPVETAQAASWPVSEADKSARQIALLRWRDAGALERLAGDAAWCDPVMAGWWAWAVCVQIGAFDGRQAWTADPMTGCIYKQPLDPRGAGVDRRRPMVGNDGKGVNHPGTREPGVRRNIPRLSDNGSGVNRPGTREPGVLDPITPAHGVSALDTLDWGQAYHDLTMPELLRWFRHLCARLRHVRIVNGDWRRVCTTGVMYTIPVRQAKGLCGVFLDPPYADTANRDNNLYAEDSLTVAHDVREWCLRNGNDPKLRIVLAGFDGEHGDVLERAGWAAHEWFVAGHLRGGYAQGGADGHQQERERLWASPHCLRPNAAPTMASLFDLAEYDYEESEDDE